MHIRPNVSMTLSIEELAASLDNQKGIQIETTNSFLLSANVDALRIVIFNDGRALVHGTADVVSARQVYKRVLGYIEINVFS
ncbi:thiamine/molybdopterin biosynthesis MoeB-like protein [compost metagenome]